MDLAAWWQDRRWKALLELIDELPGASRFNEAILNDPEQAAQIAALPTPKDAQWHPRISEHDLHAILLKEIREAVISVTQTLVAVNGGTPRRVAEFPKPETEVDRIRERLRRERANELIRLFAPHLVEGKDF